MVNKYKGVVEIEILGEQRGFKFGMAQVLLLTQLEGCEYSECQKRMMDGNMKTIVNMYYSAAVAYARLYKKPEPTFDDVANWIDNSEQYAEKFQQAMQTYQDPNTPTPQQEG